MTEPLLHVVLVEPEIPPNAGNIARLCAATRCRLHLVGPLGFEVSDRYLKRAGLDYWEFLDWKVWENWEAFRAENGFPERWHLFTTKGERRHVDASFRAGDYLLFGRESKGLPEALLNAHPDRRVRIPKLHPQVRSLNLSTAAGIGVYEALRQLEFGTPGA
ncbi:MAG: tRNA (cytidine(34)-2'-O)-methyltransferase [Verrucomicrobium sp.]|nr:tRNA (cytidine(34)-2'-O)-methyltransferase [Verrucomicrobium sp.]